MSEEHLPPQQLDLPEYVQDVPEALPETVEEVKKMATMAVRDYQRLIPIYSGMPKDSQEKRKSTIWN